MVEYLGKQIGNYRVVRALGSGGFADIYLGEHIYLHTQAAIKILQTRLAQNNLSTFLTEARIIASLTHPNIVQVLDFGEAEGIPFLIMAYAPNGTLRQRHPAGMRLSLAEVVNYTMQISEALQYAHERKIIHRDVKPENMLIGQDGKLLLSDFGIAVVSQSSRYQGKQEIGGTVAYMAPEQMQGKASAASDQYALGIIIYEWLTGEKPFNGSFAEIASQHLFTPPPPLREKVPEISPTVEQVLNIALHKDPQQRFLNIKAMASALAQCQADAALFGASTLADQSNVPNVVKFPAYSSMQSAEPGQSVTQHIPGQATTSSVFPDASTPIPSQSDISTYISPVSPSKRQSELNTPTPGMLPPHVPGQPLRAHSHQITGKRGLVAIIIVLAVLLIAVSSAGTTYFLLNRNNKSQANTGNTTPPAATATTAPVNANTPMTNQTTPAATNAPATPTVSSSDRTTINEGLHLTCTLNCDMQLSVTLDTIVVNSSSGTLEIHFTIKNEGVNICSGMRATPLYLEDPAGQQAKGAAPGTFTESNDINAGQTFQEYSTFALAPVHGTAYTLHISLFCYSDGNHYDDQELFQIETFTF